MSVVEQTAIGIVAGVVFGLYGYLTKADTDEGLNLRKLGRTTVIYGAAGAVVGYLGEPLTEGRIEAATASTVVVGEVFDKLYSRAKRAYNESG